VLIMLNPVYNYTDDAFVISGDTDECDDFFYAFNTDGALTGSEDCGFIAGGNADGEGFFVNEDSLTVGNVDFSVSFTDFGMVGDDDGSCKSIRGLLCDSAAADSFTIMCDLWTNRDSENTNDGVSITAFVPTDDAFVKLYDLLDEADVTFDDETLGEILMFHAAPGMVMSTDLECTGLLEMFAGGSSRTKCGKYDGEDYLIQKGSGNRRNDIEPIIVAADIMACDDSVVHIISEVMLPNFIEDLM